VPIFLIHPKRHLCAASECAAPPVGRYRGAFPTEPPFVLDVDASMRVAFTPAPEHCAWGARAILRRNDTGARMLKYDLDFEPPASDSSFVVRRC